MDPLARPLALACAALLALPGAALAKKPETPKHYLFGIASRSVALTDAEIQARNVYLGGYGLGNGRVGDSVLGIDNPVKPADNGFPTYDDDPRFADGNLMGGPSVQAAVISAGKDSFAIADIENQGCFTQNKQGYGLVTMRLAVEKRTHGALEADHVDVQCDHSHGGPDLIGAWGGVPTEYLKRVQTQTVDAIVAAWKAQHPADLWYGTAQSGVEGRNKVPEDKDPLLTNQMLNDPFGGANDVMDDELRVLQARDPDTGAPLATILNLNAHPTVLGSSNRKATGDWPQFANLLMDEDSATFGDHSMTIVGTLGRQQPARGDCHDDSIAPDRRSDKFSEWAICKLTQYSKRVIARTKVALAGAKPITGTPRIVAKTYLIMDPASNAGILALNDVGDLIGAPIMRSNTPPWRTGTLIGTVTGTTLIGQPGKASAPNGVLLSSMPGEAYPQIPLAVRDAVKDPKLQGFMTAGLSNDQLGYIIAPVPEGYPYPIERAVVDQNDNMLFNASQTLGERLTCSLLRGAGEVLGKGNTYWQSDSKCVAFANDQAFPEGADVAPFPSAP